ncbi:hypothetical protein VWZ88_15880 [Phaeobacter sp. JH20_36]|uniref:Major tail protein n=1 Tax=Phaeobacter inhibens TaxID=221822 RepID=A0ABM6RBU3_9RHOB|nr:hypothetical protein [Phaeobacter inhibens]AUQ93862.1 hypothetical protein PhaeoP66_01058 [Phaeobacter inhibens]AUQ97395.1 hypothetical protein PhaeoP66_04669 [Phaeobacter inhibens]
MTADLVIAADECDVEWSEDGATWAEVPGCKTIAIPKVTTETRDRTSLSSPGRFREWGRGMKDTSEVTLNCFYHPDLQEKAIGYDNANKLVHFRVQLPPIEGLQSTGDKFQYVAFVTPGVPDTDFDNDLMLALELRPSGPLDWTKGAAL